MEIEIKLCVGSALIIKLFRPRRQANDGVAQMNGLPRLPPCPAIANCVLLDRGMQPIFLRIFSQMSAKTGGAGLASSIPIRFALDITVCHYYRTAVGE